MSNLHLVKLCVGCDSPEALAAWRAEQRLRRVADLDHHVTRMWPRRGEELLDGGSLYWVFRGQILARQRILSLDPAQGEDGIKRCAIVMATELIRTEAVPRRAFQGWRYLSGQDAPADLCSGSSDQEDMPIAMRSALADIGVR